jgi:uncharacterized protein YqkB
MLLTRKGLLLTNSCLLSTTINLLLQETAYFCQVAVSITIGPKRKALLLKSKPIVVKSKQLLVKSQPFLVKAGR